MENRISVRTLVEFLFQSGDIDNRIASVSEDAMLEGARIHRHIQKKMGSGYTSEVPLSFVADMGRYSITIEGRADGVMHDGDSVGIDEIKSTYKELRFIKEPVPVHLAQAKCYAFMLGETQKYESIKVQLTYCHIKSMEIKRFSFEYSADELKQWFDGLIGEYKKWTDHEYEWEKARNESIEGLPFPFEFRKGQKELAGYVYQTICAGRKLFIQAPTGTGKTLSVLYPSIRAMGLKKADRIFYLTAKTITRTVAADAMSILTKKGLRAKVLLITAKEKICPLEQMECNPEACPYAKGHFDRVKDALYESIRSIDLFDRDTIAGIAEKYNVCPFEISLDISLFADVIICDYNYLFDPYVALKRFFSQGSRKPNIYLVDEAHNLRERGRDMYSARLVKEDVLALKAMAKELGAGFEKEAGKVNKALLELKKEEHGRKDRSDTKKLGEAVVRLLGAMSAYLEKDAVPIPEPMLEHYFDLKRFSDVLEAYDEHYLTYTYKQRDGKFGIKLFCVDPSANLEKCMGTGVASILFSATLLPIQYYKGLLGGSSDDYEVYASSSFEKEQFSVYIANDVTSKYDRRGQEQYMRIAGCIKGMCSAKKGNYLVFFPSYLFLAEVKNALEMLFLGTETCELLVQSDNMNEQERDEFLARFSKKDSGDENKSLVGLCVLGGIFSEGIDL
ncbi:MAG: PD-(D/E)XK nuclease family protein, partial [Lachnospiraceae bacterium]|nr:PD-(D/E)XK nuclease family protein [Lachnospiraceae bacterium]